MSRLLAAGLAALAIAAAPGEARAAAIPAPKEFFGFEMGTTGRLAGFDDVKRYLRLIDERSDRVDYRVVDRTTLGHEYPVVFISSPRNVRNLDRITAINDRLADPAGLSPERARALAEESTPVYMIEGTLHSTEVGATQALMDVAYRFATERSRFTRETLDDLVLMMIPSANPDGQQLVVDHFNATAGTSFDRVYPDLYHHYVGHDNNRDFFFLTQRESRTRVKLEQTYRPVAAHLLHQSGVGNPRLWHPAYDEPLSPDIDPIPVESANALGMQVGRALTAEGKRGVSWSDAYGIFWNPAYISFLGTSLLLTEVAAARDLAFPYSRPDGKPIGNQDRTMRQVAPYRATTWTLEQVVDYEKTAIYAGIESVATHADSWLYNNLYQFGRNGLAWDEGPYAYVIPAGQRDPYATYELLRIFETGAVEIEQATGSFTAGGTTYAAGSYVLRTRQPLGRWVDQLLNTDELPNSARKCPVCPLILPYTETTDNVAQLLGVDVQAVPGAFPAQLKRVRQVAPRPVSMPDARGAYLVAPESYGVARVLAALQRSEVPVFRSATGFEAAGRSFAPGTVIVPAAPGARELLREVARSTGLQIYATDATPKVAAFELKPHTKVGLVRGIDNIPGGWMMWMFDQYGIDYEVVEAGDYANLDRFDTIVLADEVSKDTIVTGLEGNHPPEFDWARGVGEQGWTGLRDYVTGGGNLVAIGSASETARELLSLPIQEATPDAPAQFRIPGALVRATYAPDVPAAWGMRPEWPVWFDDDRAYRVLDSTHARVASSYPVDDRPLRSSGYTLGVDALRGLANVISFDVGAGHATIAASQITFRSWPRVTWPIVVNSIYHGPSKAVSGERMAATARR